MDRQIYTGTLAEAGKLTSKTFKVHIMDLMPKYDKGKFKEFTEDISKKLLNKEGCSNKKFKQRNYIEAYSMTDYAIRMEKVDVFDMEKAQGVTTHEVAVGSQDHTTDPEAKNIATPLVIMGQGIGTGTGANSAGPVPSVVNTNVTITLNHEHKILEPMMFHKMELTNLHNKETKIDDECILCQIKMYEFAVIHLKGYIPQDGDEVDNKWGK